MLQNFLDESLITLTEDAQFAKLTKAAGELSKKLAKDKSSVVRYTLAAIDPLVSPDNTEIKDVKEIIGRIWTTFASVSKDTPVTYLRAIILEAVENACNDIQTAALVNLVAGNTVHYLKLSSIEQKLIGGFLDRLEKRVSIEANNRFIGKYGRTSGVAEILPDDSGANGRNTRAQLETVQMKADLLWWKFAGYSASLDQGYKEAPEVIASLAMANDYSSLLPGIYPKSANYFFKAVQLNHFGDIKTTLATFIGEIEKEKRTLRNFLTQKNLTAGRLSLYGFVNALIWDQVSVGDFERHVGIDPETEISKDLLNLWLFQDMHIYKIL